MAHWVVELYGHSWRDDRRCLGHISRLDTGGLSIDIHVNTPEVRQKMIERCQMHFGMSLADALRIVLG